MSASPRIALLTTRDMVRHGVTGMLTELPMPVHFTDRVDLRSPADLIIVDATGTTEEDARSLEAVTDDERAPVILLTSGDAAEGFGAWDRTIHTYVTVSTTQPEMVHAVARALRTSATHRASRALAAPWSHGGLSPREVAVLRGIADGKSNEAIAADLFLGVNTIKTYIRTAYRKIDVQSRPRAILWALGHGLGPEGVGRVVDERDGRWAGDDPA